MNVIFEACVEDFEEAKTAAKLGADRIEVCTSLNNGGTTPSYGTISLIKEKLHSFMKINVLIRPRGGNFFYTNNEIEIMKRDILICKNLKVDGIVIGVLNRTEKSDKEIEIDCNIMKQLISIAKPDLSITFHMAFDEITNKQRGLDELIQLKVDRVLTKGGKFGNAIKNKNKIKEFVDYVMNRIIILPGGGLSKENYEELQKFANVKEVHGTKIVGKLK